MVVLIEPVVLVGVKTGLLKQLVVCRLQRPARAVVDSDLTALLRSLG